MKLRITAILFLFCLILSCTKNKGENTNENPPPTPPVTFSFSWLKVNGINSTTFTFYNINYQPVIKFSFNAPVNHSTVINGITLKNTKGELVPVNYSYESNDSTVVIKPQSSLPALSGYTLTASGDLQSKSGANLQSAISAKLVTQIDSTAKFPVISDSALLDLIQQQTFKYFWDFGHPVCGLARERSNGNNEIVTTGGSGFGIMSMIAAVNRGFITRNDAVTRLQTITNFLLTKCQRWHGAFSHWINGSTGATIPFGKNNGADIVETSFLMQGLLTARQYFSSNSNVNEIALRDSINSIWNGIEWNWFTQNGNASSLYWQYNPTYSSINDIWSIPVTGWNEALVTYVLAASSPNFSISKNIYDNGWARNGAIKNGNSFYGITLPLGPNLGGPLFFAHYSFLGLNPQKLSDQYADYMVQNTAHSKINYQYCISNPQQFYGYSNSCWGLTAGDDPAGYDAHSPTNDDGVICPTAAISSLPYTPVESMNAIRFFYYQLGDKLWGQYGFTDAFNLSRLWYSNSYLAIDQGPQIVMIENYRSSLLWKLFMSCPEVQTGLSKLGFTIK